MTPLAIWNLQHLIFAGKQLAGLTGRFFQRAKNTFFGGKTTVFLKNLVKNAQQFVSLNLKQTHQPINLLSKVTFQAEKGRN